jgi:integrase
MGSRHARLFENEQVRRWYENIARGSRTTADVYLKTLGLFLESNGVSAVDVTRLKPEPLYNLLLDTVSAMERRQLSGSYIVIVLKTVRSWLAFNGIVVTRKIKVRGAHETPTLRDERVPSQDELRKILLSADKKERVICVLLAHSGVRPEVLGAYLGTDGLRLRDLPELTISNGAISFQKIPTLVRVRVDLSKTRQEYFTFLGEEGCEYLKSYLEMRIRDGESLTRESAVITPKVAAKPFIRTINIGDAARKAIRAAGFPWRPYVLRCFFATQLMIAESKGLIIRDYRTFFMGHKGDIEAHYTLNKRSLPEEVVEQMRMSYTKAQQYLQTTPTRETTADVPRAFRRELLLVAGVPADEITDTHLSLDEKGFQALVRERLFPGATAGKAPQKVVDLDDLNAHLAEGWEFVGLLPDQKAVVRQVSLM